MRILYVCSDFGIPVYGHKGASVHLRSMARALRSLDHDVCIVSPSTEPAGNGEFDVDVHTLLTDPEHRAATAALRRLDKSIGVLASGHSSRLSYEVRNVMYASTVEHASRLFESQGIDFVYERYALFGSGGLALARRLGVPHILEVNAPLVVEQDRARGIQLRELALRIERRLWCDTDAVLVVSDALRDYALQIGVADDKIEVVPNGVDVASFDVPGPTRQRVRAEAGADDHDVVGFVGSLKSWHGTDVLLRAFERLVERRSNCRLWIIGDGPMREALEDETKRRNLHDAVRFTGAVDHARVPEQVAGMDIAVAPYRHADAFYFSPIKVYEYMAGGVPVVASALGQIRALAEADLLTAVEPDDETALATALARVLDARAQAAHRAQRAREWVRAARTWTANARRVVAIASQRASRS